MNTQKKEFLQLINTNIEQYGFHITIVSDALVPRFAYTIGLKEKFNFELIFAGGIYYLKDDVAQLFAECAKRLSATKNISSQNIEIKNLGVLSFLNVASSWKKLTIMGAFDYYKISDISAFQILPDLDHKTLDIPDMSKEFDSSSETIWRWLDDDVKWHYTVPKNSFVVTNLKVLFGYPVTELVRLGENEWQMFAGPGPDVAEEEIRVISLATIIGIDESILPAISLEIGKGLWRENSSLPWNNWGNQ